MADLHVIEPEPADASVVSYLENLLQRARAGEFSAIAVAHVKRDGTTGSGWSKAHNLATLCGGVSALHARITQRMAG